MNTIRDGIERIGEPGPSRKPHQVVEDASGRRPHLLHEGDGEPVSPVSARGRLLVDVGAARLNAETLDLARRTFDTLRLRLIKIAARVVEMKTMIKIHLPTSCPVQAIMPLALSRIPRCSPDRRGAMSRETSSLSRQPANITVRNLWLKAGDDEVRCEKIKARKYRSKIAAGGQKSSKRCIMAARKAL